MANTKEIKTRITTVQNTYKITNAMYLIASTKLRKARSLLERTRPYFTELHKEMDHALDAAEGSGSSVYLRPAEDAPCGILIITGDRGLAGAYNQNVLRQAMALREQKPNHRVFIVGNYGRAFFTSHHLPFVQEFAYDAVEPQLSLAYEMAALLLGSYERGELGEIHVIYTDFKNGAEASVCCERLLPLQQRPKNTASGRSGIFYPSPEQVLQIAVPSCMTGFLFSALTDSYCSEQSARMNAMDAANRNAQQLIGELRQQYNHIRQNAITQEITEISSGARHKKNRKQSWEGGN